VGIISRLLAGHCRNPVGWIGRFFLSTMNIHHSKLTDWGLTHVSVEKHDTILDVGCGGGRAVRKLAALATEGKVYGIDHSEASVASTRRTNKEWIRMGRVEIRHGSVSQLPFPDDTFDLVTAVETHFFWPDLPGDVREVFRVLKPDGKLLIVAEVYRSGGKDDDRIQRVAAAMNMAYLSVDEHRELLANGGYSDVRVEVRPDKGWICGVGRKPGGIAAGRVDGAH
jgi:SAM-dependent methyltransferase